MNSRLSHGMSSVILAVFSSAALALPWRPTTAAAAEAPRPIHAEMMRFPDVSSTQIAFVYGGDIWLAPKTGGEALKLSSPRGEEMFPKFSPDGAQIAFTGDYDGNQDIYVMPVTGGVPRRITHHGARTGSSGGIRTVRAFCTQPR